MTKIRLSPPPKTSSQPEVRPIIRYAVVLAIAIGSYAAAHAIDGGNPFVGAEAKVAGLLER